jgi:hypothetical protein
MPYSRKHILLGFLSGVLLASGLSFVAAAAWIAWTFSRMFIMGVQMPKALLGLSIPLILILAGRMTPRNALKGHNRDDTKPH